MRRIVSGFILTLLLTGMLALAFNIKPVSASGTIYIRADGSVEPQDAPISTVDNVSYTFTGNIYEPIVIERDNIVVDGAGYIIQGTEEKGVTLSGRSNVTIKNMKIKAFTYNIWLNGSSNIKISGNEITGREVIWSGEYGIYLKGSSNSVIFGNKITKKGNGIGLFGLDLSVFSDNNTLSGNEITANPINGIFIDVLSKNNKILGNQITNNGGNGIILYASKNNTIFENNITNNKIGIKFYGWSTNNIVSKNNIAKNAKGIVLEGDVTNTNNLIYHNNFVNNTVQATVVEGFSWSVWDNGYPSGGNYWSDYADVDLKKGLEQDQLGSDGIGDSLYDIDANNRDRYPLMAPYSTFEAGTWNETTYNADVISNSTVSDFHFNPEEGPYLKFNVTGEEGTAGFCRVTIPKDLLWVEDGQWVVLVGGVPTTNYTITSDGNHSYLYFTYNHSTKTVLIQGTHVIPEFPSFLIMLLFMTATLLAIIASRRKRFQHQTGRQHMS